MWSTPYTFSGSGDSSDDPGVTIDDSGMSVVTVVGHSFPWGLLIVGSLLIYFLYRSES